MNTETARLGRPTIKTPELIDELLRRLANGETLKAICRDEHMPDYSSVWRWRRDDPEFDVDYLKARAYGMEAIIDDTLDIADDGRNDTYEDDEGHTHTDSDVIQRSKLRVDTRKWIAEKYGRALFGNYSRAELSGPNGEPLHNINEVALADRLADIVSKAIERKRAADDDIDLA